MLNLKPHIAKKEIPPNVPGKKLLLKVKLSLEQI